MTTTLSGGRKAVWSIPTRDLPIHSFEHPTNTAASKEERMARCGHALELMRVQMEYVPFEVREPAMRLRDAFVKLIKGERQPGEFRFDDMQTDWDAMIRELRLVEDQLDDKTRRDMRVFVTAASACLSIYYKVPTA